MKPVLVIENHAGTGLGQLRTAIEERGLGIDNREMHAGADLPVGIGDHSALVLLGGIQNALDDEGSPWFPELLALTRDFVAADKPVMGICLGSQLMARAFGGDNLVGATHEFGWKTVELNEDGLADPVLGHLPDRFTTFQYHDDTFTKPRNAVRLAGNDDAHNQAFRIGAAGYAIQFHFEADRAVVESWNESSAASIAARHPDWPQRFAAEVGNLGAEADRNGMAVARAWVELIR